MTRNYLSFLGGAQLKTDSAGKSFYDHIAEKVGEKKAQNPFATGVVEIGNIATEELSLAQYKQYIHELISQLPLHPSQEKWTYCISISDEGFMAMKNDPEYEKQVLDQIKASFSFYDPWKSTAFVVLQFDTPDKPPRSTIMSSASEEYKNKAKESFWERRAKRHKQMLELTERIQENKRLQYRYMEEIALEKSRIRRLNTQGIYDVLPQDTLKTIPFQIIPTSLLGSKIK